MIALNRGRKVTFCLVASATVGALGIMKAEAQNPGRATTAPAQAAQPKARPGDAPKLQEVRVPTNNTDPIALVNGEIITRQQLADECVARKGQEILETLIARRLIEQAMRGRKLEVTPAEIDAEIDSIAMKTAGVTREVWLLNLDKEKGISPAQYARDIIYPTLALKKLAMSTKRVQVTEQDIKDAFEANYGPRMRCRIIMCNSIHKANAIWEEVRKNPGGFETIAKNQSLDTSTRAAGGMLPEPIARHAYPREVSDKAFKSLVDGDPTDSNPAHKPKDGDFTGPIQADKDYWVIMKREELLPGVSGSLSDPNIRNTLQAQMEEVKLNDAVRSLFEEMMQGSSIDNKLTGQFKMAHEEQQEAFKAGLDHKVERMSVPGETQPNPPTGGRSPSNAVTSSKGGPRPPAGVPTDAANTAAQVQSTVKSGPKPANAPPGN